MNKTLQNLGICARAKKLITGEDFVLEAVRNNTTKLVFIASDASENTTKKITDKCNTYKVAVNNNYTTLELSNAIGKNNRKIIAIMDNGFTKLLEK